ncbi:MAG: YkvA family protein [Caldisericaceae bacterium]
MNIQSIKNRVRELKDDTFALYYALRDPRVPLLAKGIIIFVVGYALSPIDLIPDFIPVFGYLDDIIIIPLGIALSLKLVPKEVLLECREKAKEANFDTRVKWIGAVIVISIWVLVIYLIVRAIISHNR